MEKTNTFYKLSIQLNLNGFSFCISNKQKEISTVLDFFEPEPVISENTLLRLLKNYLETETKLQLDFSEVEVIYTHDLYCLVPTQIYDEDNKNAYFQYSLKILATDYIAEDKLYDSEITSLFIPYVNVNNYLIERYGEFEYKHSSALLVDYLLSQHKTISDKKVYLYFHNSHFDVVVVGGGKLHLCNSFKYFAPADVGYYTLFVIEQLQLSPQTVEVEIMNTCDESIFDLLYVYIKNVVKSTAPNRDVLIPYLALQA